jgi:glucose-6-phosphate 1-dehydrogenase
MGKLAKIPTGVGPKYPQVLTLVGGTGDLAQRKLWPGLFHLVNSGFIPACRIVGVSLDEIDVDGFRGVVRAALAKFSPRKVTDEDWAAFAEILDYVPMTAGAGMLRSAMDRAEASLGADCRRLHYLSVPA